jgi:hypothetical protein
LKVVCNAVPANWTWAPFTKSPPLTVRVKFPTETVSGEIDVTTGIGLSSVTGTAADVEVSAGLLAVTFTVFGFGRFAGDV